MRAAAAQARAVLLEAASRSLGVPADLLDVANGTVSGPSGSRISYGELVANEPDMLARDVGLAARPKPAARARLAGTSVGRLDLRAKFTAQAAYLQDMRLPGILFGRVARPPRSGAKLLVLQS